MKNMLMDKLAKQMEMLTLTLKIAFIASALASLYPSVAVPQPAVMYTLQTNFNASAAAAAAVRNLRSAVIALNPNQCAFC